MRIQSILRKIRLLVVGGGALAAGAEAPVIDGKLDDAIWRSVAPQRLEPAMAGVPGAMGGEVWAVVRGHHLLIAARLPEPSGRVVARVVGRHPNWEDEDILQITAGPDIGYTDRFIRINPFGAFTTEREGQEVYANADRYLIATSRNEREWIVEAAIPLNEMSTPGPEPVRWSALRFRAQRPGMAQQRWRWPGLDASAKAAVDRSVGWDAPAPEFRPALLGNTVTVRPSPALKESPHQVSLGDGVSKPWG